VWLTPCCTAAYSTVRTTEQQSGNQTSKEPTSTTTAKRQATGNRACARVGRLGKPLNVHTVVGIYEWASVRWALQRAGESLQHNQKIKPQA